LDHDEVGEPELTKFVADQVRAETRMVAATGLSHDETREEFRAVAKPQEARVNQEELRAVAKLQEFNTKNSTTRSYCPCQQKSRVGRLRARTFFGET
jgi:hypothetical protein